MYIEDRLTVARAMRMISEEDLQKLEFYMVEHKTRSRSSGTPSEFLTEKAGSSSARHGQ